MKICRKPRNARFLEVSLCDILEEVSQEKFVLEVSGVFSVCFLFLFVLCVFSLCFLFAFSVCVFYQVLPFTAPPKTIHF